MIIQEFEYKEHPNLTGESRRIKLSVSVFDSLDEAMNILGVNECLKRINDSIIKKAKADWNNNYCKELRNGTE